MLALLVSQDGSVPRVSQSWDGKASDPQIFQERAAALLTAFAQAPTPRHLVADAQLSHEANAPTLATLGLITRMPGTLTLGAQVITQALTADLWQRLDETTRAPRLEWRHDGMPHRWLVVSSQAAMERAAASVTNAQQRAWDAIATQRLHWHTQRFETPDTTHAALAPLAKSWRYHQVETSRVREPKHYAGTGRPTSRRPIKARAWQRHAAVRPEHERIAFRKHQEACLVIGTNSDAHQWRDSEVLRADKAPARVAEGFRLLKDPLFFVSSWFVKKPCRVQGLLLVMPLAWLGYAGTPRRLRQHFACQHATIPNPINHPTERPTLRWVFQLLEGMHRVRVTEQETVHDLIEGLNAVQIKLLHWFGDEGCRLSHMSPG